MNTITILNVPYKILGVISKNISDSFVDTSVKTGYGNGETRLYISNQNSSANGSFFEFDMYNTIPVVNLKNATNYYHPCKFKGFFLKDNLIKYMQDAYSDYINPKYSFNQNISEQFQYKLKEIYSYQNDILPFTIHKQDGNMDMERFYIGSGNIIWHKVRTYTLPFVSKYIIYKIQNQSTGEIFYFFQVTHKSNKTNEIYTLETSDNLLLASIQSNNHIPFTEKETLIKSRIGQGLFRERCLSILNHCPFTNITNPSVLRASHIIPWSRCSSNEDRLNGFNGLTLSPFFDVLFDKGLISFQNNGQVLMSTAITSDIIHALNLSPTMVVNLNNVNGLRNRFLKYHRENIFIK
ncbi:HNH endonuclease [Clostridium novyi]|uniref:HNH endonuclease n=1 Tax=Clostridium novyi TaxID=1542 RepID=UPI00069FE013|nr:HNH endonuclease [Clostridium novyi]